MNTNSTNTTVPSTWLDAAFNSLPKNGTLNCHMHSMSDLVFDWVYLDSSHSEFNQQIQVASDILVSTYTAMELEYAKLHPTELSEEHFLKAIASMVESNEVDWELIGEEICKIFKHFFASTDFSQFAKIDEKYICIQARKRGQSELLGFAQFMASPLDELGAIKGCYFGVSSKMQTTELEKALMSCVLHLVPDIKRLYLHTRATNVSFIRKLKLWGFVNKPSQNPNWPDFEYLSSASDCLHKTSQHFEPT